MFDMAEFLKENLIRGYWEGSFSETQINIFATNYMVKGWFSKEDVSEVIKGVQPPEENGEDETDY